jgi:hypothetical protein
MLHSRENYSNRIHELNPTRRLTFEGGVLGVQRDMISVRTQDIHHQSTFRRGVRAHFLLDPRNDRHSRTSGGSSC